MILNPTADQLELAQGVRRFLDELTPLSSVRAAMESDTGFDGAVWKRLCHELAIPALAVSAEHGGAGFGMSELSVAMQECGAALLPGPLLGSGVICAQVLDGLGATEVLRPVLEGDSIAALARDDSLTGSTDNKISGSATGVLDAMTADVFVVVAGDTVYAVVADDPNVVRSPLVTLDPTRRQGTVRFNGASGRVLGPVSHALEGLDRAAVALAAEQLGAMRRAVDLTVEYAEVREQFGRPIGSFQAVKHGLADIYVSMELATGAVSYAAWAADHAPSELPVAASAALAYIGPAAFEAASQMIQYHGGIGYTWEHDAHLYYKRIKTGETLLAETDWHLERIAAHLLDEVGDNS